MKGKWFIRCLLLTLVVGLMAVIFAFSAQPGPESEMLTEATVMPLAEMITGIGEDADARSVRTIYEVIATIVRKLAHLSEYALLGLLLRLLMESFDVQEAWIPAMVGVAYAVTDEVHQLFVPGRSGLVTDVLIDAAGILCGMLLLRSIQRRWRLKHVHDQ